MKVSLNSGASGYEMARTRAEALLRAALSKKAHKPVLIRLTGITALADYFLIVSARSKKQARAIAEAMLARAHDEGFKPVSTEGLSQSNWILLDLGDVIVHVFHTPVREFYDLEGLWRDAPREVFPEELQKEIDEANASEADDEEDDDY